MHKPARLEPPATPQQASLAFARAMNCGDLKAAAECFAEDGCLITPDATAITGRIQIRSILAQLIARKSHIEVQESTLILAGRVALGSERWLIRSQAAEGGVFQQTSNPTLVLCHMEGAWKLAIAAPWGWGPRKPDEAR
jgi:ketosteroid isomerase-like protein